MAFLHNVVQEVAILEAPYPPGSISAWVLLSCLEVLLACEKYSDSSNRLQYYCLFTASLWSYAREKLYELGRWKVRKNTFSSFVLVSICLISLSYGKGNLPFFSCKGKLYYKKSVVGELCGLTPNKSKPSKPSSEQLHRVVELSSGIRDPEPRDLNDSSSLPSAGPDGLMSVGKLKNPRSPSDKLKEALSSKATFQEYYLVRAYFWYLILCLVGKYSITFFFR